MLTFQLEPVERVWNQVMELAAIHWAGTKSYRRHYPFHPQFDRFQHLEQVGMFHCCTARDGEKLVGYFGLYLSQSMDSQHWMITEHTMFLHPDYRGGTNAIRYIKHILKQAREWGVVEVLFSHEIDNETGINRILEYLDFKRVIVQYSLQLQPIPCADSANMTPTEEHVDVGAAEK